MKELKMISLFIIAVSTLIVILTGYVPLLLLPAGICIGMIGQELYNAPSKSRRKVQARK